MGLMLAAYVVVVVLMGRYINRWIMETVRLRLDQAAVNSKLQAAVAESKAILNEIEQIYRYSPVGLCFMDTNYRYVRINEHMAEINGLPVSAHIGHTLREVIPDLADGIMELYRPVYERGEPVLNAETARPGAHVSRRPASLAGEFLSVPFRNRGSDRPDRGGDGHHRSQADAIGIAAKRRALPHHLRFRQRPHLRA